MCAPQANTGSTILWSYFSLAACCLNALVLHFTVEFLSKRLSDEEIYEEFIVFLSSRSCETIFFLKKDTFRWNERNFAEMAWKKSK